MKKYIIVILCVAFLLAGCTGSKVPAPKPDTTPNTNHLTAQKDGITLEVSRELKTFPKNMLATKEGYDIVGLSVIVINKSQQNVPISPDYVTLVAIDNTTYKYSEITESVTGKGAFRKVTLPPDYRGGGLLLFEIKKGIKINKVIYKDQMNHEFNINFESGESSSV
ncbi:hypothetical protein [Thermincola ferriacetica]